MKIKLTEKQFERLKLINEAEGDFEKYKKLCADSIAEVDKLYLDIVNATVSEYLSMSINANDLDRRLSKIETAIYNAEKNMLNMYESGVIGQGVEDFDMVIEKLASSVTDKITSLSLMLQYLSELQDKEQEFKMTRNFKGIKPMEIQSF